MFGAIQLKMLHVKNGEASRAGSQAGNALAKIQEGPHFRWETCLRTIAIFPDHMSDVSGDLSDSISGNLELLSGEEAYEKLLELICGLHSPILGETEVFGQFKDAVQKFLASNTQSDSFDQAFRAWANGLLEDAKLVRRSHLQNLGSQSYGSLVRRELREFGSSAVDILGAGRLVCDILPWISKKSDRVANEITVHCRDLVKAHAALNPHIAPGSSLVLESLAAPSKNKNVALPSILLIAAPLTSAQILDWMRKRNVSYQLILDLRATSNEDFLETERLTQRYLSLDEVFKSIHLAKKALSERRDEALLAVKSRRLARESMALHRPFGWDDV